MTLSMVAFLQLRVFRRDWLSDDTSIGILVACLSQANGFLVFIMLVLK